MSFLLLWIHRSVLELILTVVQKERYVFFLLRRMLRVTGLYSSLATLRLLKAGLLKLFESLAQSISIRPYTVMLRFISWKNKI